MFAAFINLMFFSFFLTFSLFGLIVFLIGVHIRKHPETASFWFDVARRLLEV